MERISSGCRRREVSSERVEYQVVASVHSWSIVTSGRMRSQFPNFFDLKLREAVSHALPSFDCHNLRGIFRQLGVDRLTRFAGQQIDFSILSFDSSCIPIPYAHLRALVFIRTVQ